MSALLKKPLPMILVFVVLLAVMLNGSSFSQKENGKAGSSTKASGALWNPFHESTDNHPVIQKVLVLNYDPFVPSENGKRLREVFGWNNPMQLADEYKLAMEYASGGALQYEIVEWRNLNEIYAQRD